MTAHKPLLTSDKLTFLLSLVPFLVAKGEVSVSDAARHFEVTEQYLRQTLDLLTVSGVPGESRMYDPQDLFDLDWQLLEDENLIRMTQLVGIDRTLRFSGQEIASVLIGLNYLSSVLPPEHALTATTAGEKLATLFPSWRIGVASSGDRFSRDVASLQAAISNRKQVEFRYVDATGQVTRRLVRPRSLMLSGSAWYLRAELTVEGTPIRFFRLDRMSELTVTDLSFTTPATDQTAAPQLTAFVQGAATTDSNQHVVTVSVEQAAAELLQWFAHETPISDAFPTELDLTVRGIDALVRHVCSLPGAVTVRGPAEVRDRVAAWASSALSGYSTDEPTETSTKSVG